MTFPFKQPNSTSKQIHRNCGIFSSGNTLHHDLHQCESNLRQLIPLCCQNCIVNIYSQTQQLIYCKSSFYIIMQLFQPLWPSPGKISTEMYKGRRLMTQMADTFSLIMYQGRQCTVHTNVTLRCVHITIAAMEKQWILHILGVCL